MASVAVLLCTYNGGPFLAEQLDSIFRQTVRAQGVQLELHVADDGSTDGTLQLLESRVAGATGPPVSRRDGPRRGHAANFLTLACAADIQADFFAYCDQDDIWDVDKLERALARLSDFPPHEPALYCARTRSITQSGEVCGTSPLFTRKPSFQNALLQNIGGGNTMVMNRAARELLLTAGVVDVVSHDWWTYLLVAGAGGGIVYDRQPCLSYRQHGNNAVGDNSGAAARLSRYGSFARGRNRQWYARNLAALEKNAGLLTGDSLETMRAFSEMRDAGLAGRLRSLRKSGLYAQTFTGQLGLYIATLLKKI